MSWPLVLTAGFLSLSCVLAIALIPVLGEHLRRETARRAGVAANDNAAPSRLAHLLRRTARG